MPSHLTRHVINCLITNQPIVYRGCIRRQAYSSLSRWHHTITGNTTRRLSRRAAYGQTTFKRNINFTGLLRPNKAVYDNPSLAPGIELMQSLVKRQTLKARLIPVEEVDEALLAYLNYMVNNGSKRDMLDTHASLVHNALKYILQERQPDPDHPKRIDTRDFKNKIFMISKLLVKRTPLDRQAHLELALFVLQQDLKFDVSRRDFGLGHRAVFTKLCSMGDLVEARDLLLKCWTYGTDGENSVRGVSASGMTNLKAEAEQVDRLIRELNMCATQLVYLLARAGDEAEMLRTVELLKQKPAVIIGLLYECVTVFYAERKDIPKLKEWYSIWMKSLGDDKMIHWSRVARAVAKCCTETGDIELGNAFFREAAQIELSKPLYDETLAWNLAVHQSTDEIVKTLDPMIGLNRNIIPDTTTINRLIETSIAVDNPYMAERIVSLGRERGIQPNGWTYTLQMDYRISVNDLDGAMQSYRHLIMQDLSKTPYQSAVNRFLVALCSSGRHDFETIMGVAADLSDRRQPFKPETIEQLCLLHLRRDEMLDAEDLIKTHANELGSQDRQSIRRAILNFCTDAKTPVANIWDTYNLLRETFDEMPREERVEIIQSMFERDRPDMVAHVFAHMRQHFRADTQPNVESYVVTLLGCGKTRDMETLGVIHNQLKLDTNIDVTTRLRNALMIAYASCAQPRFVMTIWDDIVASAEGPTYNSLLIALRTCENIPFGDVKAQQIWERLRKNKVTLDKRLWTLYLSALAANGNNEVAVTSIEDAVRRQELEVDGAIIAAAWHGASREGKEGQIASWARSAYPQIWEELQQRTQPAPFGVSKLIELRPDRSVKP